MMKPKARPRSARSSYQVGYVPRDLDHTVQLAEEYGLRWALNFDRLARPRERLTPSRRPGPQECLLLGQDLDDLVADAPRRVESSTSAMGPRGDIVCPITLSTPAENARRRV